ncbi:hypothetical protein SBDP1_340013 [Syntrophobacter sp. SbD1]|nr:hypothetical protein SBDP1_340013 [Syntrophobacter sp. SbD1]
MYDLNFSRPFNPHKWSDEAPVNHITAYLLDELSQHIRRNANQKRVEYQDTLKKVILDLFIAHGQHHELFLAYSRDRRNYVRIRGYGQYVSYHKMIEVVDALLALGYIFNQPGYYKHDRGEGMRSRMIGRPKLIDLMNHGGVKKEMIRSRPDEIVLRAADDRSSLVGYRETVKTSKWKNNVAKISAKIGQTSVRLSLSDAERMALIARKGMMPDCTNTSLYRVFNNGRFDHGGRFYGYYVQGLPKEFRKRLTIDGEPTTELDYSGLHINFLYLREGLRLPEGDVYDVGGLDHSLRELLKKVLIITLNAKNERSAIRAIRNEDVAKGYSFQDIREIMGMFGAKHEPIRKYFNSGIGIELQFVDSGIAENIMLGLAKNGIACLPIHDSFIVKARYESELRDAMNQAMMSRFGAIIPIDKRF